MKSERCFHEVYLQNLLYMFFKQVFFRSFTVVYEVERISVILLFIKKNFSSFSFLSFMFQKTHYTKLGMKRACIK